MTRASGSSRLSAGPAGSDGPGTSDGPGVSDGLGVSDGPGASSGPGTSDGPAASNGPAASDGPPAGAAPETAGGAAAARARRRRRRSWRAAFFALAAAGIVAAAAWVLFGSRLLVVRSVVVTGTHLVPRSQVLAVAGVQPGIPLIRVNTARIAARVDTIRQVGSVRVTRSWPDRVVITVRERTPVLAVPVPGGGYDLVDPGGVVVRWVPRRPRSVPLYLTAAPAAPQPGDPALRAAATVLGELPAAVRHSLDSVTAPGPDQVRLQLAGQVTVLWGGTDRAAAKAHELTILMRTHAHHYDVSAPGTVTAN